MVFKCLTFHCYIGDYINLSIARGRYVCETYFLTTDLNIYKTGKFNWNELKDIFGEIYENPKTYNDLDQIEKENNLE